MLQPYLILFFSSFLAMAGAPTDSHWRGFRGNDGLGVADGFTTPTHWNAEDGTNIKWKLPIPGLAHASPIVWGDSVYVLTAVSGKDDELKVGIYGSGQSAVDNTSHSWRLYRINKQSGKTIWEKVLHEGLPKSQRHIKASQANCTPATDGKYIVSLLGSEGLFCYDTDGNPVWKKDLGILEVGSSYAKDTQWGYSSSPIIHDGQVYIQCDTRNANYVMALDVKTGKQIWKTARNDDPTYATPTIARQGDVLQLLVNGYKHMGAYDARTGKELWKLQGGGDVPVPRPFMADGLVYMASAHGGKARVFAINPEARGDISLEEGSSSNGKVVWSSTEIRTYMQTPVYYRGYLYCCRNTGIMGSFDAKTGELLYKERLGRGGKLGFTASAVAADGKLYYTSEEGDVFVVKAGPKFELLATNPLGEICMASPAISEGTLFFRTRNHLIAVGN